MRKMAVAVVFLALLVGLAGCSCGGKGMPSSSGVMPSSSMAASQNSSSAAVASSVSGPGSSGGASASGASSSSVAAPGAPPAPAGAGTPPASSAPYQNSFVHLELLTLPGTPLPDLEPLYGSDYFVYEVGLLAGALDYYDPYISFIFYPGDFFGSKKGDEDGALGQGPFSRPDLTVSHVSLKGEFDAATQRVTGQASLERLFAAGQTITYSLLQEKLQQSPELAHSAYAIYTPVSRYEIGTQWERIEGGSYMAEYEVAGVRLQVTFVKEEESYVALYVTIG